VGTSRRATLGHQYIALIYERPLFIFSIAAAILECEVLAKSQILNLAVEVGLLVDRGGARRAAGENSGAKRYSKNDRFNFHGIFLSNT
jgi:hypothetical protein